MPGSSREVRLTRKSSDVGVATAFLAPAILMIVLVTIIPICMAIRTSFHATNYAEVGAFVGLDNFIAVFTGNGLKNILNSIRYVLLSLVVVIPLGVAIGSLLNRKIRAIRSCVP